MSTKLSGTLISTLSPHLSLSKSRLETLAGLIICLVNSRTVNLTHIAAQFSSTARTSSSYRRLQRFFQYVRLDEDWLARTVIKLIRTSIRRGFYAWTGPTGKSAGAMSTSRCWRL